HDSWDESHSGLGGPAMIIIIIIVTYFTAGAASGFVASAANAGAGSAFAAGAAATAATATTAATQAVAAGWANAALTAMLTSAASTATVSTINNKGNLGAAVKETFSADSMKNYIVAGAVAGLTTGLFNDWTGTTTEPGVALTDSTSGALANTGKVVVSNSGGLSSLEGIAQFTANQALQNSTSALLNKALGRDGSLGDALQSSLVNAFAAYGFNLVGDISVENGLPNGGLAKIGLHAVMGGLASLAAGGDFKTGALAAGVNEALVDDLASVYAGMPKEDRDRLLLMNSQLIGVLTTAVQDPDADTDKLQTGAWAAQNGTQYNFLNHDQLAEAAKELRACGDAACREETLTRYKELSFAQDLEAAAACSDSQASCADYSREVANTMANLDDVYQLLGDGPTKEWDALRQSNLGFQEMLATFTAGHTSGAIAEAVQQKWGLSDEQTKIVADNLVLVAAGGVAAVAAKKALTEAFGAKGTKGAGNATLYAADDIRFSQNTVSFNKTDRISGTNYTYDDLVQSMKTNGWKGDPVDVVRMPDGKLTSMDNTRIAAAREAGIDVNASVRGFDDPLTPAIQEARGWQSFDTWGEAITGRINKQSGGFSAANPYGSTEPPRISGGGK
ncbi:DUF637 domain-containing protein, partial [Pseudomonas mandelii]|uniref:DUF637 domain-containing protein n=1 Tax=Pseudomonas mandelii TaxID=75612 RepID=UPI0023D916C0